MAIVILQACIRSLHMLVGFAWLPDIGVHKRRKNDDVHHSSQLDFMLVKGTECNKML